MPEKGVSPFALALGALAATAAVCASVGVGSFWATRRFLRERATAAAVAPVPLAPPQARQAVSAGTLDASAPEPEKPVTAASEARLEPIPPSAQLAPLEPEPPAKKAKRRLAAVAQVREAKRDCPGCESAQDSAPSEAPFPDDADFQAAVRDYHRLGLLSARGIGPCGEGWAYEFRNTARRPLKDITVVTDAGDVWTVPRLERGAKIVLRSRAATLKFIAYIERRPPGAVSLSKAVPLLR